MKVKWNEADVKVPRFSLEGDYRGEVTFTFGVFKGAAYPIGNGYVARDIHFDEKSLTTRLSLYGKDFKLVKEIGAQSSSEGLNKLNLVSDYYAARVADDTLYVVDASRAKPVAMCQVEFLSPELGEFRSGMDDEIQFAGEIPESPHVVVTAEQVHRDPRIRDLCQFTEKPGIAHWNHSPVFEPEIEQVAHKINGFSILPRSIEPGDEPLLTLQAGGMVGNSEMKVRSEVDLAVHGIKITKLTVSPGF